MRQVWISRAGPPEVLELREAPDPEPAAGEVRVRVSRSGINFADLMARVGLYPDAPPIPCVVGYETAGVVDRVGKGVTGIREGDRVMAMPKFGGYTDTLVVAADQVFAMPAKMTFDEGAALPVVYLTAYTMMIFTGNLRPRSKVLIHSAAGGVGLAAIDIAKTRECEMFGLASKGKHNFLRERGVQHVFKNEEDWPAAVRELTAGQGLDLVLDPVGGKSWRIGYDLLGPCGRLVAFGLSAAASGKTRNLFKALWQVLQIPKFNPTDMMGDNKTVTGVNMGHLFSRVDLLRPQMIDLVAMYEKGQIAPYVSKVFPAAEAPAAHHFIHDRKAVGKVLLGWD
ncbi:MAG: zinc-binding dehydrogenase [Polyangiaceae bacterium]|nr:zinc-binding dehydrogenase [Polyangiaceae bacterium]